ncbi:MAG TPA: hypothetical protein VM677_18415 [Actinokineospora sp.]|jgi:hypothetical protein|nr:hypothetical protein [Actinokineospora sp.]
MADTEPDTPVTPTTRGLLDGTLNNAQIIDHIAALNTNVNSDPETIENVNSNTRAKGDKDNSSFQ